MAREVIFPTKKQVENPLQRLGSMCTLKKSLFLLSVHLGQSGDEHGAVRLHKLRHLALTSDCGPEAANPPLTPASSSGLDRRRVGAMI